MVTPIRKEDMEQYKQNNLNDSTATQSVTIKEVYSLLLKEVQMPTLQSIPFDIYKSVAITLENLKEQEYEGLNADLRDRIVNILSQCLILLLDIRQRKLLEQPTPVESQKAEAASIRWSKLPAVDYSKLTNEEKYILDAQREFNIRKKSVLAATLQGRPKVLESISSRILSKQTVVRFIKPMEQFIGVNMAKYGPYHEEDVAVLPFENARSLMENGVAVQLEVNVGSRAIG